MAGDGVRLRKNITLDVSTIANVSSGISSTIAGIRPACSFRIRSIDVYQLEFNQDSASDHSQAVNRPATVSLIGNKYGLFAPALHSRNITKDATSVGGTTYCESSSNCIRLACPRISRNPSRDAIANLRFARVVLSIPIGFFDIGVPDPTCGSGDFLPVYHIAHRSIGYGKT